MSLYIEPNAGPAPIIQVIQSARREISAGVYYLADRPILNALKAAHARGVNIRIIIEGKPYGMKPWQVQKEERAIEATGATLHLAPYRFTSHGGHYAFQHSTCAVITNAKLARRISTGLLFTKTVSTFTTRKTVPWSRRLTRIGTTNAHPLTRIMCWFYLRVHLQRN